MYKLQQSDISSILVPTFNTKQQGLIHYAVCPSDGTFTRNLSLIACERPKNSLTNNNNVMFHLT